MLSRRIDHNQKQAMVAMGGSPDCRHDCGETTVKPLVVHYRLVEVIMAADGKGVHGHGRLCEVALVVLPRLQAKVDGFQR